MHKTGRVRLYVMLASILLFIASLTQTAYYVSNANDGECPAFLALLTGWVGLGIGGQLAWLANPLLLLSWIFYMRKKKAALYTSMGALLVAISFTFYREIVINEAGTMGDITGYGRGYFLWLASIGLMAAATIITRLTSHD